MIIIGISGKKLSGKDTVYEISKQLIENGKSNNNPRPIVLKHAFADGVKEECSKATKFSIKEMEEKKNTFRVLYQWWGTDFRRKYYGNDYWIKYLRDKIQVSTDLKLDNQIIFITDVRFKNEAEWIKSVGGFLIRVERGWNNLEDQHQSEIDLDHYNKWDYIIVNNGTLDQLKKTTLEALKYIKSKLSTHNHIV